MASPRTRPGTQRLSEVARKVVIPSGITATGWPAVSETCRAKLGVTFDGWQDGAGRAILAKRADGKLACTIGGVGMSVCRQVGKTYLIGGMTFGLAVNRPGMLIIWSAHHARTHGETFLAMQAFAQRSKVKPYIEQVFKGSGDEEIRFRNGSRILFGARERGFGRGVPGVDMIVSDEAQIMSEKALDAQLATMNTSEFGLAVYLGTPPRPEDPSEAFTRMRTEAWDGTLQDAVWIEIGAAPGTDPNDRKLWSVWNPSHPKRTPVESILRLQRKLSRESFLREGMGMWDSDQTTGAFGPGIWDACAVPDGEPPLGCLTVGVAVSVDRAWSSVGLASSWGDGRIHVGANRRAAGTAWVVSHVKDLQDRWDCEVVLDPHGPGSSLLNDLLDGGVRVVDVKSGDVCDAYAVMYDRAQTQGITHMRYDELEGAVAGAATRNIGERVAWGRRTSRSDISMLEAVTLAAWRVATNPGYDVLDSVM